MSATPDAAEAGAGEPKESGPGAAEAAEAQAETAPSGGGETTEAAPGPEKKRPAEAEAEEAAERPSKKTRRLLVEGDFDGGVGWPASRPRAPRYMHGWFLATHERVFAHVLKQKPKTILELGSWYGASTEWLAKRCPDATIYAVDLWEDAFILDEQRDHYSTMGDQKLQRMLRSHPLYDTFLANLWDDRDTVVPLKMRTTAGVAYLKERNIVPEVIYIDADHHYDSVKEDISACLDAFPDAVLVGDDYGHYDDVRNAVTECAVKYKKTVHVDQNHCWTYVKIDSVTGRNFVPKPKPTTSFADLLKGY